MKIIEDKLDLNAEQILSIAENAPEKLFSGDLAIAKSEYRALGRRWHPDFNSDSRAGAVFQHVNQLFKQAQELIETARWRGANVLELSNGKRDADSIFRRIRYFKSASFELGDYYVGETAVVFSVERQFADLFENASRRIADFKFANSPMQKEISRCLPQKPKFFATAERLFMVLPKTPDMILLADLLEHLGGAIDARHVAWIVGGLHNLACYFDYAGIVHHDISPLTVLVSPEFHTITLLGGWWYALCANEKISALPERTLNFAPADAIRRKRADARTDLELIRQTGREMLGDKTGARLTANEKIPAAMARWFNGATSGAAVTDYELWRNVLEMDFGKPRFCRLAVEPNQVYSQPRF